MHFSRQRKLIKLLETILTVAALLSRVLGWLNFLVCLLLAFELVLSLKLIVVEHTDARLTGDPGSRTLYGEFGLLLFA